MLQISDHSLNRYNGADVMFLFIGWPVVVKRLSFISHTNFLFSLVSILKLWKDGEWSQVITNSTTLKLNFFCQWWDSNKIPNSYISYTFTVIRFIAESTRYDTFILFCSPERLQRLQSYLNRCHVNIFFTIKYKRTERLPLTLK